MLNADYTSACNLLMCDLWIAEKWSDKLGAVLEPEVVAGKCDRRTEGECLAQRHVRFRRTGHRSREEEGDRGLPGVHGTLSVPIRYTGGVN